jgi:hypothetical protein
MELAATDEDVLQTSVHFDKEVAGFDSRDGTTPKALGVLCAAGQLLRENPTSDALAARSMTWRRRWRRSRRHTSCPPFRRTVGAGTTKTRKHEARHEEEQAP